MRVLILRPEPGNAATSVAVAAMGLKPVSVPLFEVASVVWAAPDPTEFDVIAMTSANAARHGGPQLVRYTHLPLIAVGEATADAAKAAGFDDVTVGEGDAGDLAARVGRRRILHLTGTDHRPIPGDGAVTVVAVYETRAITPSVPLSADIALVHSPRAGARFAELAVDRAAIKIVAISPAAARACGVGWAAIHVADAPREHAMLASLAQLCKAQGVALQGRTP